MIHRLAGALALACLAAFLAAPALAADTAPAVILPWGDWLATVATALGAALVAALVRALSYAPALVKTVLTEQLLKRAVDYALGAVSGAARGKTLAVPVANDVIRTAAQYAIDHGAPWLIEWIGELGPKIVARLSAEGVLPPESSAALLTAGK